MIDSFEQEKEKWRKSAEFYLNSSKVEEEKETIKTKIVNEHSDDSSKGKSFFERHFIITYDGFTDRFLGVGVNLLISAAFLFGAVAISVAITLRTQSNILNKPMLEQILIETASQWAWLWLLAFIVAVLWSAWPKKERITH